MKKKLLIGATATAIASIGLNIFLIINWTPNETFLAKDGNQFKLSSFLDQKGYIEVSGNRKEFTMRELFKK